MELYSNSHKTTAYQVQFKQSDTLWYPTIANLRIQTALDQVKQKFIPSNSSNTAFKIFIGFLFALALIGLALSGILYYHYYKLTDFHSPIPTIQTFNPVDDGDFNQIDTGLNFITDTHIASTNVCAEEKPSPQTQHSPTSDQTTSANPVS